MATPTLKPASTTMTDRISELDEKREKLQLGGGKQRIQKQHELGKLTARERIAKLVGSRQLPGDRSLRETSRHLVWYGRQGTAGRRSGDRMRHR